MKRILYNKEYLRIDQKPWELLTKVARVSRIEEFNHPKALRDNVARSLKQIANDRSCSKSIVCSRLFKRFNSFTSKSSLSNIFCFFSRKKRFCFLSRCNLTKEVRNCFVATNWVAFTFNFSSSSFANARSIASKFTIETIDSHFFLCECTSRISWIRKINDTPIVVRHISNKTS